MTKKIDIVPVILKFSHEISSDKIVIVKVLDDGRTLMKQLEDVINEQIEKNVE